MNLNRKSTLLILFACFLWGTDLVVRYPLTLKIGYVSIVFLESLIGFLFVTPWLATSGLKELKRYSTKDWLLGFFLGGIGMSLAGYLATACIQKATPGTFAFFQIWQPFFVIYMAHLFLREKSDSMYFYWGIWVVLSAILMFSQDLELMFSSQEFIPSDILIALSCMIIWGSCTIAAKKLLVKHSPISLVAVRWMSALIVSSAILFLDGEKINFSILFDPQMAARFVFIGGVAGVISMFLYYSGLKGLPAGKVSFIELSYSAFGMIFSAIYTFEGLTLFQSLGAVSFFSFIFFLFSREESTTPAVGAR